MARVAAMRPGLFAALVVLAAPGMAWSQTAAEACAVHVQRLAEPLGRPDGWRLSRGHAAAAADRDGPHPPFDPAAHIARLTTLCADKALGANVWDDVGAVLLAAGETDAALAVAEDQVRLRPTRAARSQLAVARLRKGDQEGALKAWPFKAGAGVTQDRLLSAIYYTLLLDVDDKARPETTRVAEAVWRKVIADDGLPGDVGGLASILIGEGLILEAQGQPAAAGRTYGRAAALSDLIKSDLIKPTAPSERRVLESLIVEAHTFEVRALVQAGDRQAATKASREMLRRMDERLFVPAGGVAGYAASTPGRSHSSVLNLTARYGDIARDLIEAGAAAQAVAVMRGAVEIDDAFAKDSGRRDGEIRILLAKALRLNGASGEALQAVDQGLALLGARQPLDRELAVQGGLERGEILTALKAPAAQACDAYRQARTLAEPTDDQTDVAAVVKALDARLAEPRCRAS